MSDFTRIAPSLRRPESTRERQLRYLRAVLHQETTLMLVLVLLLLFWIALQLVPALVRMRGI